MIKLRFRRTLLRTITVLFGIAFFGNALCSAQDTISENAPPRTYIAVAIDFNRIRKSLEIVPDGTASKVKQGLVDDGGLGPISLRMWFQQSLGLNSTGDVNCDEFTELFREAFFCDRIDIERAKRQTTFVHVPDAVTLPFFGTPEEVTTILEFNEPIDPATFVSRNSSGFESASSDEDSRFYESSWRRFGISILPPSFYFSESKSAVAIASGRRLSNWQANKVEVESLTCVPSMEFKNKYQISCVFQFLGLSERDKEFAWERILTSKVVAIDQVRNIANSIESGYFAVDLSNDSVFLCEINFVGEKEANEFANALELLVKPYRRQLSEGTIRSQSFGPSSNGHELLLSFLSDASIVRHGRTVRLQLIEVGGRPATVHRLAEDFAESTGILERIRRFR